MITVLYIDVLLN